MNEGQPALAVYGGGPRLRAIAGTNAAACGWTIAGTFADIETAAQALAGHRGPTLVLDARCSLDAARGSPERFASLEPDEALTLAADRPTGAASALRAGLAGGSGAACMRALTNTSVLAPATIGTWTAGLAPAPAVDLAPGALEVDAYAHVYGASGYATAGRNLLVGLRRNGVDVAFQNYWGDGENAQLGPDELRSVAGITGPPRRGRPTIVYRPVTSANGGAFFDRYRDRAVAGPMIGCTMFETDALPPRWVPALERCEAVWVPSTFGRETFVRAGVSEQRVRVVPIGIDMERYDPDGPLLALPGRRRHAFLSIFEWGPRKGPDVLLAAWARAFGADDDVVLYVRTGSASVDGRAMVAQTLEQCGIDARRCAPIVVLAQTIADADWASLFRSADTFVLPSRGEGFCIPYLEAMALGIPVIGIGHGGSADFLDESTGFVVDVRIVPVEERFARQVPLYAGQRWAEPDVDGTAAAMRSAVDGSGEGARRAARAFVRARSKFDRDVTGAVAARALAAVPARHPLAVPARFTLKGPLTSAGAGGAAARAILQLAEAAGVVAAVEPGLLPRPIPLDEYDELRIASARERAAVAASVSVDLRDPDATIRFAPCVPDAAADREVLARAAVVWAPSTAVVADLISAGVAASRLRVVPVPVDTDRTGPDTESVYGDPAIIRFLTVVAVADTQWQRALVAYANAFEPAANVSLTLLLLEPPSEERAANIRAALDAAASGRPGLPPVLLIDFGPDAWANPHALGIHHVAVGSTLGPWPLDALIASSGLARVDAEPDELASAALDARWRSLRGRAVRRRVVRTGGGKSLRTAFEDALDEIVPSTPAAGTLFLDDVRYVIVGVADDPATVETVANVEATRALEGTVDVRPAFEDAPAAACTERYLARIPAGCRMWFGWDLQLLDALRRRLDADAVAMLRSDDAAVGAAARGALNDPLSAGIAMHQFSILRPSPPPRAVLERAPRDTVVLARSDVWRAGIANCATTEATMCHGQWERSSA